jgi:hypothetical protein
MPAIFVAELGDANKMTNSRGSADVSKLHMGKEVRDVRKDTAKRALGGGEETGPLRPHMLEHTGPVMLIASLGLARRDRDSARTDFNLDPGAPVVFQCYYIVAVSGCILSI